MYSLRRWIFRPKKTDSSLLAQFFYADEELNMVAAELDSFDGRKDPERCTTLVNQLRSCQDKVLNIIENIMDDTIPLQRANRDFRVKFPDDVLQESLAGQLWFGAECLAAGSSIMNREVESSSMRPLAKALTRHLDFLRSLLRDQCLKNLNIYNDKIDEALVVFDRLFAEFELSYVSAMVPVKSMKEYDVMQEVIVLFCETVQRALKLNLLTQDMIDDYDPALMFTIPRLAIVCGLLVYPEGPLNPDMDPHNMSEMFRPFQTLLYKIRELLWTLNKEELWSLEKSLCSAEEPGEYRTADMTLSKGQLSKLQYPEFISGVNMNEDRDHLQPNDERSLHDPEETSSQSDYDFGAMVQSPSAVTIVPNPDYDSDTEAAKKGDENGLLNVKSTELGMHHQDSADSGMLSGNGSVSDSNGAGRLSNAEARRLRQSMSWPSPKNESRRRRSPRQSYTCDADLVGATMSDDDEVARSFCIHRSGSHEFSFNLPLNTEQCNPTISINSEETSDDLSPTEIIYTNNVHSVETDRGEEEERQVSFITSRLNDIFVTDTSFQRSSDVMNGLHDSLTSNSPAEVQSCISSVRNRTSRKKGKFTKGAGTVNSENNNGKPQQSGSDPSTSDSTNPSQSHVTTNSTSGHQEDFNTNEDSSRNQRTNNFDEKSNSEPSEKDMNSINQTCNQDPIFNNESPCSSGSTIVASCSKSTKASNNLLESDEIPKHTSNTDCLDIPKLPPMQYPESVSSTCSSCKSHSPSVDGDWDRESYASSDTSSYNSECHDDEEIALAIQAAELEARREARSRFKSSSDLIHRLFVCISGVADQLQTNYAGDLRHILKSVFETNAVEPIVALNDAEDEACRGRREDYIDPDVEEAEQAEPHRERSPRHRTSDAEPPPWIPDDDSPHCTTCKTPFTFVRRRHHCRNCGKIFCGRCSSNSVPLPHFGHQKPVRVCNHCFMFQVTHFTVDTSSS